MEKRIKSTDITRGIEFVPHEYQKKAIKFLLDNKYGALFLDPGLGKTSITLSAILELKYKKMLSRALIVAPLLVCHNVWPAEIKKWTQFNKLSIEVCHGKNKQNALESSSDIVVINYEGLQWLFSMVGGGLNTINKIKKLGFNVLVFDELSKMKNPASKRFRILKPLLNAFTYRWGLTGSPAANGLMDLFGECFVIDGGKALGKYITHFRHNYFMSIDPKGFVWRPLPNSSERIFDKIAHLALRMGADDYLDMPNIIYNNIYIELDKKTRKIYDELESELIVAINNKIITAANAAVASGKCRQVCSGAIYTENNPLEITTTLFEEIHNLKIETLANLIDELQGQPLLVGYEFIHEKTRLTSALKGYNAKFIKSNNTTTNDIVEQWNKGHINILLGQPQSMGHGLNLQGNNCSHACWLTPTWNFELYDQFNRRIYRQGNTSDRVFIHHIIAKNTIDEVIMHVLHSKSNKQNALFDALVEYAKK